MKTWGTGPWRQGPYGRMGWHPMRIEGRAGARGGQAEYVFAPEVDVYDGGEHFVVRADLPGVRAEDLEISVEGAVLSLRGERRPAEGRPEGYLCCERLSGKFARLVEFPVEIDASGVKASLRSGVLEIILPKNPAVRPRPVRVTVES
ncbi:MAG: Hsp20/alpha crystallin family protein [Armatimonadota bacterium]|nr:Hsp20/alpha crystallin family protein [Armatimonadota bacterium]